MSFGILLTGIFTPALFWLGSFTYKDRARPEPFAPMGTAFLLGLGAAWICLLFYSLLPFLGLPSDPSALAETDRWRSFGYALGVIGLLEEACKLLPFLLIVRFKSFDEEIDGIIYASAIALGFASWENIRYLQYLDGFELYGRAFASPLTHTVFSSIWGYVVGRARIKGNPVLPAVLGGVGISAALHGLFDFFTLSLALRIPAALLILSIWIWMIRILDKLDFAARS